MQSVGHRKSASWYLAGVFVFGLLSFRAPAFDVDGQTDIVWYNCTSGETAVWFMNLTRFTTSGRITNDLGAGWTLAACADFNRDGQTDLFWRSPASGSNEIWLMRGTNRIARHSLASGATNFYAVGAGDFNADGYADILWRDHDRDLTAVWFMHATNWGRQVGWIRKNGDPNWHAAAAGDCNGDGEADIYWRHATTGRNAVWLMRGTNVAEIAELKSEPDLGFDLSGVGPFNPVGNSDLLWRHTNGLNRIWLMSGTNFLSSAPLPTETNRDWTISGTGGYTNATSLTASVNAQDASLVLSWRHGPAQLPAIRRRTLGESAWTTQAVAYVPLRFTNSNLVLGDTYEYEVGDQYLLAGLNTKPIENRGKVILVIENSVAIALAKELEVLQTDLIGDGWTLIRTNVPRHNDSSWRANTNAIASIKSFVKSVYDSNPLDAKAVFLIGHVPIPYSGFHNPDGHGARALPADGYYGDVDGIFSDRNVNYGSFLEAPYEARHDNRIGDGRFDQNRFPPNSNGVARLELAVGRIDFAKLPIFKHASETVLLRRYLDKDHRYRHKQLTAPERVTGGTFFPTGLNRGAYGETLKIGSRLFGPSAGKVVDGDPLLPTNSSLWGVLGGFGLPYGVHGQRADYHESKHVEDPLNRPRVLFANLFASYCLDFDYTNNFMRAFQAAPDAGLAVTWFRPVAIGNVPLSFESLGLGDWIGSGFLRTINNNPDLSSANTYLALLGDPTLRLQIVAPPRDVVATGRTRVTLTWTPSTEGDCQYHVYRSTNGLEGPWPRITQAATSATQWIDRLAPGGPKLYQVRAFRLTTTGSGSFTNMSQGVFVRVR